MFNSNINYSNYWFFKCQFALHSLVVQHSWYWNSPVECTDVFKSDLYERSVLRQTTCLLLLMKGEVKKHVYKDLRNKAQHLCAFFPSCKPSYINFVAILSLEGSQKQLCERGMNDDYNHFYKSLLYLHFSDTTRLKHWTLIDAACASN